MGKTLLRVFTLLGLFVILYLSWLPHPKLGLLWFMPNWLADWTDADENNTLRTGVPFVGLGLVVGVWPSGTGYGWLRWLAAWLGLVAIVLVAEAGQLFLPDRSFDWLDIAWGAAGAMVGLSVARLGRVLKTWFASGRFAGR